MIMTYIIVLVMVPFLVVTYKVEKPGLLWSLIIIPPLLISPLALIPIRGPATLGTVWLPVLLFVLGSIIILIIRISMIIIKTIIRKPVDKLTKIKLIRPILTIFVFISVFIYHRVSLNMANQYVFNLAKDIQTDCDSNGLCPDSILDWKEDKTIFTNSIYYSNTIYKLCIPYPVNYYPSVDRKSFTIDLIHGFNMGIYIDGGINQKLKAVYSNEGFQCEIPIE